MRARASAAVASSPATERAWRVLASEMNASVAAEPLFFPRRTHVVLLQATAGLSSSPSKHANCSILKAWTVVSIAKRNERGHPMRKPLMRPIVCA